MGSRGKVTIEALARELGLAKSTVSRALNGYPDIAEETRSRVQAAALASGYAASSLARSLKRGRVDTVGIVLPGAHLDIGSPFLVQFLRGATKVLEGRGVDLLVANAAAPERWQETYDRLIVTRKVDGFILTRTLSDDPRIAYLREKGAPFVAFGRTAGAEDFAWLDVDCGAAAGDAAAHLAALGHHRIGHVAAPESVNFARLRREAVREKLTALGLYEPSLIVEAGMTADDGRRATTTLMGLARPPTALICDLDLLAFGAMAALRDLNLTVGSDVSVLGYGDIPLADLHSPPLSTWSQDSETAGGWVAEMLLALINGTAPEILQRLRPADFLRRGSDSAPARDSDKLRKLLGKAPALAASQ